MFTHAIRTMLDDLVAMISRSADAEDKRTIVMTDVAMSQAVSMAIRAAGLKSLFLLVSSGSDVTLDFGDAGTIDLKSGIPSVWQSDAGVANPFSQDVTELTITKTAGAATTIELRILQDSTV